MVSNQKPMLGKLYAFASYVTNGDMMKKQSVYGILIGLFLCLMLGILYHKEMNTALTTIAYKPLSGITIVLDAGHGGKDNGAMSNGINEQDINLSIVLKLQPLLKQAGANVQLTRDGNYDLASDGVDNRKRDDMKKRVALINDELPDIFISVHLNAYPNTSVRGAQAFYQKDNPSSKELANRIQTKFKELTGTNMIEKPGDYYILNETNKPGVLVECGFLSNPDDRSHLHDEAYQQQLAECLFDSILEYFDMMI